MLQSDPIFIFNTHIVILRNIKDFDVQAQAWRSLFYFFLLLRITRFPAFFLQIYVNVYCNVQYSRAQNHSTSTTVSLYSGLISH
jgi:hypothetical protein